MAHGPASSWSLRPNPATTVDSSSHVSPTAPLLRHPRQERLSQGAQTHIALSTAGLTGLPAAQPQGEHSNGTLCGGPARALRPPAPSCAPTEHGMCPDAHELDSQGLAGEPGPGGHATHQIMTTGPLQSTSPYPVLSRLALPCLWSICSDICILVETEKATVGD